MVKDSDGNQLPRGGSGWKEGSKKMFNRLYQSVTSDRQTNGDLFEEFASQYFDMRLQEEANKGLAWKKQWAQKIVVMNDL